MSVSIGAVMAEMTLDIGDHEGVRRASTEDYSGRFTITLVAFTVATASMPGSRPS